MTSLLLPHLPPPWGLNEIYKLHDGSPATQQLPQGLDGVYKGVATHWPTATPQLPHSYPAAYVRFTKAEQLTGPQLPHTAITGPGWVLLGRGSMLACIYPTATPQLPHSYPTAT